MRIENLLPEIYYKESRDFAYIGRCLNIVADYIKTNVDCVRTNYLSTNLNDNITTLLADTYGFKSKHKYFTKDLVYIANNFTYLLKNKGSLEAIDTAIRLLLNSQGLRIASEYNLIKISNRDQYELDITIPSGLEDIILLEDIFDYILPAGITYRLIRVDIPSDINENKYQIDDSADIFYPTAINTSTISIINNEMNNTQFELLTIKPGDWDTNWTNYYEKDQNDNYVKLSGDKPEFNQNSYYVSYYSNTTTNINEYLNELGTVATGTTTVIDESQENTNQ